MLNFILIILGAFKGFSEERTLDQICLYFEVIVFQDNVENGYERSKINSQDKRVTQVKAAIGHSSGDGGKEAKSK